MALVALIFFSSTKTAGDASEFAYRFYKSFLGWPALGETSLLRLLAEKAVHVLLFFSLGFWVHHTPNVNPRRKLWIAIAVCLVTGTASEILQAFTARDPQIADGILNLASGALGAAIAFEQVPSNSSSQRCVV